MIQPRLGTLQLATGPQQPSLTMHFFEPKTPATAEHKMFAPADITWGLPPREAEDLVQPDVFVIAPETPAARACRPR